jgi:L-alanine-DL-glutamate epimerase-like enolase superfamily enzyme
MVNNTNLSLTVAAETWPIAGGFTISRGSKTEAAVVVAELTDGTNRGRGECVPYARYGETVEGVVASIEALRDALAHGLDRMTLQDAMARGAARNALDCAFWDIEAKRTGRPAHQMAGMPGVRPVVTAYTISLGTPAAMADAATRAAHRPLLKVKLGGKDGGDSERIAAVRRAVPNARLIVDANEGWSVKSLAENLAACETAKVELIEQPLPAGTDDALPTVEDRRVNICADESVHGIDSLDDLLGRYDVANLKLDKTGGLTEAFCMLAEMGGFGNARGFGLGCMVGCMVATSLAMAPAVLLAQRARYVDLDGPLLLARDREPGLRYDDASVYPPQRALWG